MNWTSFAKKAGIVFLFCFVVVAVFLATPASAYVPLAPSIVGAEQNEEVDPGNFFSSLITFAIGFSGVLAVLVIVWGGVSYITAAGDTNKVAAGRERITSAILGLILVLTSWLILNTINPELVQLNLNIQSVGSDSGITVGSGGANQGTVGAGGEAFSAMYCGANPRHRSDIPEYEQRFVCSETPTSCQAEHIISCNRVGVCVPVTIPSSEEGKPPYHGHVCDENKYGFCASCAEVSSFSFSADTSAEGGCALNYTCFVKRSFGEDLEELSQSLAVDQFAWKVTKAWPPAVSHQNSACHKEGACVDANFILQSNPYEVILTGGEEEAEEFVTDIYRFIDAAQEAGVRAEYKVGAREVAQRVREIAGNISTVDQSLINNVKFVPSAANPHFTIYE